MQGKSALCSEGGRGVERVAGLDPYVEAMGPARRRAPLCAEVHGFSLHAAVSISQGQTERLERLCRYVARGPLAIGRLSLTPSGHDLLRLRKPWRDGTTYLRFEPLAFIEAWPLSSPGLASTASPTTDSSVGGSLVEGGASRPGWPIRFGRGRGPLDGKTILDGETAPMRCR